MMLTADTAQAMGISDRGNPEQSIFAGARYLAQVRDMIPERIAEPDRTWLTVAAYNVGFGHLEDARIITQALGKNPDSWAEVRERLPLLAQERWYTRAGAATPAAGSRCSSSIASSAFSRCSNGSPATAVRADAARRAVGGARRPRPPRDGVRAPPLPAPPPAATPAVTPRPRGLNPPARLHALRGRTGGRRGAQARRCAKNSCSRRAHSSISTPPNTSTR